MATKVIIQNPVNGLTKNGYFGFSWTYLFFGFFVPLVRGELGVAALHFLFAIFTGGIAQVVIAFLYNKQYMTRMLEKGYVLKDSEHIMNEARVNLGLASVNQEHPVQGADNSYIVSPANNNGFSWMSLFFAPYYYAGYGKFKKGLLYAFIGVIPLTSIIVNLYAGFKAKKELPIKKQNFNWGPAIGVFVIHSIITSAALFITTDYKNNMLVSTAYTDSFASKTEKKVVQEIQLPLQEKMFIEIVSKAQKDSFSANNDMQKGGIKRERDKSICALMSSLRIENWIGNIKNIDANSDGRGILAIEIAPDIILTTTNNELSDMMLPSLIDPSSALFQTASSMREGQKVEFSGNFFNGIDGDCVFEQSLTLDGKILEPEFVFKFTALSVPTPVAVAPQETVVTPTPSPVAPQETVVTPTPSPVTPQETIKSTVEYKNEEQSMGMETASFSPSFDCSKASTLQEKLVCKDRDLASLDVELSALYKRAREAYNKDQIRSEQRNWLRNERNSCQDIQCLNNAYKLRINELKSYF